MKAFSSLKRALDLDDIITFGKYKDKQLKDILFDGPYLNWLEDQKLIKLSDTVKKSIVLEKVRVKEAAILAQEPLPTLEELNITFDDVPF